MNKKLYEYSVLCKVVRQSGDTFSEKNLTQIDTINYKQNLQFLVKRKWELVCSTSTKNKFGYYGVSYKRGNELVIVHRGTQFYEAGNIAADLLIAAGIPMNPILNEAEAFSVYSVNASEIPSEEISITHVGFSLGGYIAGTMAARNIPNHLVYAYTFDAPGVVMQDFNPDDQQLQGRVFNYFLEMNLVNTCSQHNGAKYQITSTPKEQERTDFCVINIDNFYQIFSIPKPFPDASEPISKLDEWIAESKVSEIRSDGTVKLGLELTKTLHAHAVEHFINHFQQNSHNSLREITTWPCALIQFNWGNKIPTPHSMSSIGEILSFGFQSGINIFADILFKLTHNEQNSGIVGMIYRRPNNVLYTDDYNQQLFVRTMSTVLQLLQNPQMQQMIVRTAQQIDAALVNPSPAHNTQLQNRFFPLSQQPGQQIPSEDPEEELEFNQHQPDQDQDQRENKNGL